MTRRSGFDLRLQPHYFALLRGAHKERVTNTGPFENLKMSRVEVVLDQEEGAGGRGVEE